MPQTAKAGATVALVEIFDQLHKTLAKYKTGFSERTGTVNNKRDYHLILAKPVVIGGRKYDEIYFASIIQQGAFVGFYFMPIYYDLKLRDKLPPGLHMLLKGKSCFYVKRLDASLIADIEAALKMGVDFFRKNGWL